MPLLAISSESEISGQFVQGTLHPVALFLKPTTQFQSHSHILDFCYGSTTLAKSILVILLRSKSSPNWIALEEQILSYSFRGKGMWA